MSDLWPTGPTAINSRPIGVEQVYM